MARETTLAVTPPIPTRAKKSKLRRCGEMAIAPLKVVTNRPSNHRDWSPDLMVLPEAEFNGDEVTIRNVRNFTYRTSREFTPGYYDKTFRLSDLQSVWFGVEPFGDWRGPAHTFVSFGFKDGTYLALSVEIRRVKGETYSAWKGLWNCYELTYVIADERDVVQLRTNHRKSDVYLYPVKIQFADSPAKLLVDILERVNALHETPEFYNSLFNTCTTNLLRHFNHISPRRLGWSREILFPVDSDRLAYQSGLIDKSVPFEEARRRALITPKAQRSDRELNFSRRIREAEPASS